MERAWRWFIVDFLGIFREMRLSYLRRSWSTWPPASRPSPASSKAFSLMITVSLVGLVIPIATVLLVNRWSRPRAAATTS